MAIMPKNRPLYLQRIRNRHGNVVWYFHRRTEKRVRIRGLYGAPDFMAAYHAALAGIAAEPAGLAHARLSLAWCVEHYMASIPWQKLAAESRKQMSYQFSRIVENAGAALITAITRKTVLAGQERRGAVPSDANKYVRAMTLLCRYALDQEWIAATPVHGIAKLPTSATGEGFYTWDESDKRAFEACWPMGTRQRLAYEIFRCTGLRRADAMALGWQHVRDGQFSIRTAKTGMVVEGSLLPSLRAALQATPTGDLQFITKDNGKPFKSKYSFGNWFKDACLAAGIKGNAHGIRKAVATEAAEATATEAQLNSFFGWAHGSRESATYVQKASRKKMAGQVGVILTRTRRKGEPLDENNMSLKSLKRKRK